MSDIGSNCHYFEYEQALKYSFEMALGNEKAWRYPDIWALQLKRKAILHKVPPNGHPSNPIRCSLTVRTRLFDHRSIHRIPNLSVQQDLIPWTGRQCKLFMTHISSLVINNSPTPSILQIVSKPDMATRKYCKKKYAAYNIHATQTRVPIGYLFLSDGMARSIKLHLFSLLFLITMSDCFVLLLLLFNLVTNKEQFSNWRGERIM